MSDPAAWLVAAFDTDRQYAGNAGYADEITSCYRFDSNVPNHKRIAEGDLLVIRDKSKVLGVAAIEQINRSQGHKTLNLCPNCRRSGLKIRKTVSPAFRCHSCGCEFDKPIETEVPVTNFSARYERSFVATNFPLDLERVRAACPTYNGQHAMQRIELELLGAHGSALVAAAARASRHSEEPPTGPTADPVELERRTRSLRRRGTVPVPPGQDRPATVRRADATAFLRDPAVRAWVLQEARGICEACGEAGPFTTEEGAVYLEVHHVVPLAAGGSDTVANAIAVCPDCHRALHLSADRALRTDSIRERVKRLASDTP